jgi:predicted ferric reductase
MSSRNLLLHCCHDCILLSALFILAISVSVCCVYTFTHLIVVINMASENDYRVFRAAYQLLPVIFMFLIYR